MRKYVALVLALAIPSMCSPVFAGDFASFSFNAPVRNARGASNIALPGLPSFGLKSGLAGSLAAFSPLPVGQQQAGQVGQATSQKRGFSKAGKILMVIGSGLAVTGAIMVAKGGTTTVASNGIESVGVDWRSTGYVWLGVGAALDLIALLKCRH